VLLRLGTNSVLNGSGIDYLESISKYSKQKVEFASEVGYLFFMTNLTSQLPQQEHRIHGLA